MQKELEQLRKEKEGLNLSLDSERHSHLIDVQLRFKRCLEILQINTEEGLANFLKGASESEDLEEYLAMKFNVTKAESSLFQRRVLCLQAPYSKQQLIQRFIQNVGKDVTLIDKDQIAKHYTRLVANILQQQPSVDEFLKVNGFDKVKIMHYYLVEKIVSRLVPEATMHQLTTHLLNQSRNFYQIEVKVLKEQLLKHLDAAKTLPKEKPPSKSDPKPVAEEEDQYEYFEEDDDLDEEEKLMMEDERAIFNSAVDKLKSTNKVPSADPSMTIQLSKNQLNMSAASIREPRQQQPSAQKVDSP